MERPEWEDWHWQMRRRVRSLAQLQRLFPDLPTSLGTAEAIGRFPMAITPYYASLIRSLDPGDPILQMCVPQGRECCDPPHLCSDPLKEDDDMPVPGLVHRYEDRALLLATTVCGSYCRHCTRKRIAGQRETTVTAAQLRGIRTYLEAHPEVRDVIVSGGDPFTMETTALEAVLQTVRGVPSVDVVRIGTRCPVVMPMRVTDDLVAMLRRYHPLYVNTHFNHPAELTPRSIEACERLADAGIPMGNQSVLLRGVNDSPQILEALFRGLLRIRVRPYYLYQCDLVRGVEHFRTPLARGIEIMEYLRGRLSGLAIPSFIVDAPDGGGKIPVLPNYVVSVSPTHTVLRNYQGVLVAYPEPSDTPWPAGEADASTAPTGVWHLASGNARHVEPAVPRRRRRKPGPAHGDRAVG
ncbi:MAG: KamA family radical SAM protein [Candidatus Brocadiaceae bacterium]|nr:KamA family radical SAM protein [Candidatus Brocadiaceae bacterium]